MLDQERKAFSSRLYYYLRTRLKRIVGMRRLVRALANWRYQAVLAAYQGQGIAHALGLVEKQADPRWRARAFKVLARLELSRDVLSAAALARHALLLDDSGRGQAWACMTLWDAGCITEAYSLLARLDIERLSPGEREKALQIEGTYRLLNDMPKIPRSACVKGYEPRVDRILYVASSSRPYHTTGYTTRTHHLLESLRHAGWDVHCVTRPGYPFDRPDARSLDEQCLHRIDGLSYQRLAAAHRRELPYDQYLTASVLALEAAALDIRPAVIHAASNYEAALPALIVARRLGIAFCYEVRGLWEYTAASKKGGWDATERFQLDRLLEAHTASQADRVFTLTRALADELQQRGVARARIDLLPNAVDMAFFKRLPRDGALAEELGLDEHSFVVGYIGSVVKYEGLDDLIRALAQVIPHAPNTRVLIVGDGDELENLRELVKRLRLSRFVVFTGRVAHGQVARYFSLLQAMALPRKPYEVCELVSPLKPFEAMAMRVPLVVSDVNALNEIVVDHETALVHKAGDPASLAAALTELAHSQDLQRALAAKAFNQVCLTHQWSQVIRPVSDFYRAAGAVRSLQPAASGPVRLLCVGSLPPEWGGASRGGVASIHKLILEQWLAQDGDRQIELVGVLVNNWSGTPGAQLPDGVRIFQPPSDKALERGWYAALLASEQVDCVLFFHIANRWGYWHGQLETPVAAVGAIHSWHALTLQADQEQAARTHASIQQALPHFQQLLFPSRHSADEGISLGLDYATPVCVVPNSIGAEFLGGPLAQPQAEPRLVFVGSLIPRKRVDLLIRAAAELRMNLLIIGDGQERGRLEDLARALGHGERVDFVGEQQPAEVAEQLRQSSLLCVPSESESFGIVYLEAAACGIPVVGFAPTLDEIEITLGISIGEGVVGGASLAQLVYAIQTVLERSYDRAQLRAAVQRCYSPAAVADGYRLAISKAVER